MYHYRYLLLLFTMAALFAGCHFKDKGQTTEEEACNYPVSVIADTLMTDVVDKTTLYPLSEDFMDRFIEKAFDYEGHKVMAKVSFPNEWGIRCVERLPEGRELWLLQSQSREWMYLAITSGYGTQRIIDLMPVAVNLANQNQDQLETEKWMTIRRPDGSFLVQKDYEWIHSLTKATKQQVMADPEKYHRQLSFTEHYVINEMGHFELTQDEDTLPDYNAVVFFYHRNEKPESWDDCVEILQSYCEENNILSEEVYQNYNQIIVSSYDLSFSVDVDITPYIGSTVCGMVMLKKGEEPKVVNFGSFEYMQMAIRRYFKISSTNSAI